MAEGLLTALFEDCTEPVRLLGAAAREHGALRWPAEKTSQDLSRPPLQTRRRVSQ